MGSLGTWLGALQSVLHGISWNHQYQFLLDLSDCRSGWEPGISFSRPQFPQLRNGSNGSQVAVVLRSGLSGADPKGCPTALKGITGLVLCGRRQAVREKGLAWRSQAQMVTARATDSDHQGRDVGGRSCGRVPLLGT